MPLSPSTSSISCSVSSSSNISVHTQAFDNQAVATQGVMNPMSVSITRTALPSSLPSTRSSGSSFLPPVGTVIHSALPISGEVHLDPKQTLQRETVELRARLMAKDEQVQMLEAAADTSEDLLNEWQAKYDRLWDAHRKLQKTNHSLEDKLLRIVDNFEADKNQMTRDLASQTQKLVQSKLMIQQLHDQNGDLQSDLQLSITLLQNRPSSYLTQRVDSLPADMQSRVRSYMADRHMERMKLGSACLSGDAKKIQIPIMDEVVGNVGDNEKVSAAILAKVLDERAKERKKKNKFCINVGTQTHGWQFPDKIYQSPGSNNNNHQNNPGLDFSLMGEQQKLQMVRRGKRHLKRDSDVDNHKVIQILRSISLDEQGNLSSPNDSNKPTMNNILMTSVIRSRPSSANEEETRTLTNKNDLSLNISNKATPDIIKKDEAVSSMKKSATFSAIQTDM